MSDESGSGSSAADRERKGKGIKYSDDDPKETEENRMWQQIPSPYPSVLSGLSAEDLAIYHMMFEIDGGGSFEDFVRQQQQALQFTQETNIPVQKDQTAEAYQEECDINAEIDDLINYSTDSDANKEDLGPIEELVFEIEISDRNRLVIPYAMASNHFPPMMISPNAEEALQLYDPFGRMWKMTLIYDSDAHTYVITKGLNAYLEHNRLNTPDLIRVYLPVPQLNITDFYIQHQKILGESLFEVLIPRSNRLPIPCAVALNYFKPSQAPPPPGHLSEYILHLTDYLDRTWEMRFICFDDEEAYIVVRGWEQYAAHHGLNHRDTIRFFRQNPSPNINSFIVYHEFRRRRDSSMLDDVDPPLFLGEDIFCELRLSETDVRFGRLELPGFRIPFECHDQEMVKLTDENNKDWYVIIVYTSDSREYMILDGWEGIVKEHNLEAGDMVRFYKPVYPQHDKHFLIQLVKKKKNAEKEEGGSDSGKPNDSAERDC